MFGFRGSTVFRDGFDSYRCKIEITTQDGTNEQIIEAPRIMLEHQIKALLSDVMYFTKPAKIKISRMAPIYNEFEGCIVEVEYAIEFENNAWLNEFGEE